MMMMMVMNFTRFLFKDIMHSKWTGPTNIPLMVARHQFYDGTWLTNKGLPVSPLLKFESKKINVIVFTRKNGVITSGCVLILAQSVRRTSFLVYSKEFWLFPSPPRRTRTQTKQGVHVLILRKPWKWCLNSTISRITQLLKWVVVVVVVMLYTAICKWITFLMTTKQRPDIYISLTPFFLFLLFTNKNNMKHHSSIMFTIYMTYQTGVLKN